jgi:hypothetical protein
MKELPSDKPKLLFMSDFVFPKTHSYPIEDVAHARDALARSSGKPQHDAVVDAVSQRYPDIDIEM